jgi:tetratricopeptide (TPR) repeat protein
MSSAHIIYAALFRLSVIAAGFGCVVMGYRLFVLGVMPREGSGIDSEFGQLRLSLKNAAPGTCFAALGVIMIIAMVVQGNPEKKIIEAPANGGQRRVQIYRSDGEDTAAAMSGGQRLKAAERRDGAREAPAESESVKNGQRPLDSAAAPLGHIAADALANGRKLEAAGSLNAAIRAYAEPLKIGVLPLITATGPLRAIAAVYLKQRRLDEGLAYALLAYQADPDDADGLALTARIQQARGKHTEALNFMSKASQIDAAFMAELARLKAQGP